MMGLSGSYNTIARGYHCVGINPANLAFEEENYIGMFPPIELCGDNAAMIAIVGLEKFKLKQFSELNHPAKPRWPLDESAAFLKGAGVKL